MLSCWERPERIQPLVGVNLTYRQRLLHSCENKHWLLGPGCERNQTVCRDVSASVEFSWHYLGELGAVKRGLGFVWHICGRDIRLLNPVTWLRRVEVGVVLEKEGGSEVGVGPVTTGFLWAPVVAFSCVLGGGSGGLPHCFWKGWRPPPSQHLDWASSHPHRQARLPYEGQHTFSRQAFWNDLEGWDF